MRFILLRKRGRSTQPQANLVVAVEAKVSAWSGVTRSATVRSGVGLVGQGLGMVG